ncbi:MAG: TIGR04283 family arsenosugar biosynthesis glycosyltransferase [Bacteroidia bacterium]
MKISIIIPTWNEEVHIGKTVAHLLEHGGSLVAEICVSDGGSSDKTQEEAENAGARFYRSPQKGRAGQMNFAVTQTQGEILYFVHADSLPPHSFATDILDAVKAQQFLGGFRQRFDSGKLMLRINSWFTRFNRPFLRGGDQSLFITRALFEKIKGYDETYVIMEEYDLMRRASSHSPFHLIPKATLTSARKYEKNSWLRVQLANWKAVRLFKQGASPTMIRDFYKKTLQF